MTTHHTPGPWSFDFGYIVAPDVTGQYPDVYIAKIEEEDEDGRVVPEPEQEANARLIAAAPAMLKALQRLTHPAADDEDLRDALDVIARATGQPVPEEDEGPEPHTHATPDQISAARELYALGSDDNIEIDDDARVSKGEGGAFVQAWVWVPAPADEADDDDDDDDDEGPEHHATLESAFADAIGHDNYQRLLDQKWLPFAGKTHLSMSLADAVAREVKAATKFLQTLDTVEDEGPEPPYAGYESEAQLRRMAEVRALRAARGEA